MKEGLKIVVDASSIFDEANNENPVRFVRWEIQQYGINIKRCRYCGKNEVTESYFVPQAFLDPHRLLEVDMIQLTYSSPPEEVGKIVIDEQGWGNYPSNLYIPIEKKWCTIREDMTPISVIAVNNQIIKDNLNRDHQFGTIETENGNWEFYINFPIERAKSQPEIFSHISCARERQFVLLHEEDLKNPEPYFEKVGDMYISPRGDEVLYKGVIYTPYKTQSGSFCLLEKYGDKGILGGNKLVSYKETDDGAMIYDDKGQFIDYVCQCRVTKNTLETS